MAGKVQRLSGRVHKLRAQGKSIADIALTLGVSTRSITRILNNKGTLINTSIVPYTPPDARIVPSDDGTGEGNSLPAVREGLQEGGRVAAPADTDRAHLALVRRLRRSIAKVVRDGVGADGRTSPASAANALVSAVDRLIVLERRLEGRPLDGSPAGQAGGQPIIVLPAQATAAAFADLLESYRRKGADDALDVAKAVRVPSPR